LGGINKCLGGANMRKVQIYSKNIKKQKKLSGVGGCRLSIEGGGYLPFLGGGVKISLPIFVGIEYQIIDGR